MASLKILQLCVLLVMLFALGACTTTPNTEHPADVEDRIVIDGKVLPLPESPNIQTHTMANERPVSSVVKNLMRSAQSQRSVGNFDAAANSLERALRIEPRNAKLWSRLADVRYAQKQWQKAIQMAAKSNTLAGSDQGLRRQNWYLMANAYDAVGNQSSAQKYRDKLSQQLVQ